MSAEIILSDEQRDKIIELYKSGIGSSSIQKQLNIPKFKILKLLNSKGILRKKPENRYDSFFKENEQWCTFWTCSQCKNQIKACASEKFYLLRNISKRKNICKGCTLENQKGEGNPFYGKTHSDETKKEISKNRKGKATGINSSVYIPGVIEKIVKTRKLKFENGEMEHFRKIASDTMKRTHAEGKIKSMCRSKAEFEIIAQIEELGYEVIPTFKIKSKSYDMYLPEFNLIIEYNGNYWHSNPKKYNADYYNVKKSKYAKEIWEYDANKIYLAESDGYIIRTVWESDYKKDKNIVIKLIKEYLNK
jgi:hypothetical protein